MNIITNLRIFCFVHVRLHGKGTGGLRGIQAAMNADADAVDNVNCNALNDGQNVNTRTGSRGNANGNAMSVIVVIVMILAHQLLIVFLTEP